jgi:DNA-binding YbaB/EbfC family protein
MKARLPQGMGGGPQNMNHVIRQAQKMREDAENLQAELDEKEYDVSAGGGMVTVKIKGTKEILDIKISPDVIDPEDPETLQDILVAAMNEAIRKVEDTNSAEMEKITGSLNIPGLF